VNLLPLRVQGDVLVLQCDLAAVLIDDVRLTGFSAPTLEHVLVAFERLGRVTGNGHIRILPAGRVRMRTGAAVRVVDHVGLQPLPVRVHGHIARQRPGPVVQARIVLRSRVPAEEPVAADLRHVARPPAGPVRRGRVVSHGYGRRGGRHLARPGGRLVRVVGEDRVADPHRVHGHAALDHRDLGLRLGRVPVLVPTQLGVARTRQHAGIPAVVVLRHGRQRDPLAGRIVDLAAGHHVRARVDGLDGHAAVLMRGGALHEVGHLAVGLRFRGPSGVSGRVGRDGTGGILRVLVVGETVGDGRIDRLEAGPAGLSRGDRPADAEGRAGERGADVMLHSMRVGIVLVLVRGAGPAVRAEPGEMRVGAHVRAIEAADEFDALVVSAGAAVKVGESGHTTQSLRRGTVIQQEIDGHIHVRAGRGMQVPLAIRRQELVLRFVVHQGAEVLAVHGDLGIEPPLRAGGVAPLSHMVQDQVRAILVRLVHGVQTPAAVCLVLHRGIPVRFDGEAVHVGDLVRGDTIGCGELEIAILHRGDFTVLQIMHREAIGGLVRHRPHRSGGLGLGGLDGVLLAVLAGGHAAGRVLRVLVVGERVGELELHVVNQVAGNTIDGTQRLEREPADRLAGGDFHRTLERVPRAQPAIRVRSVHRGGLLTQPVAPVGRDAGHLHRPLVAGRSDEDLDLLIGVDGAVPVRVPELHGVHGGRAVRGADVLVQVRVGLRGGDLRVHVVVRAGALDLDDAAPAVDLSVGLVGFPTELGRVEPVQMHPLLGCLALAVQRAADLHVAVRGVDVGEIVFRAHLGLADDVPPIMVEITVHDLLRQAVGGVFRHIIIRHELHAAVGLVLGGLGGVLPAALVRRNLAGGIRSVLVVVQAVCLVEHDVVEHVAVVELLGVDALEREAGRGLPVGDQVGALVGLPLVGVVAVVAVGDLGGDGGGLLVEFVAVPVDGGAGHFDGLLVAGRADHDLHLIEVRAVEAGVLQQHLVQGAGHGPDVLVDGGAGLVGAELRVHVVGGGVVVLEFDRVGLLLDVASGLLGAGPAELGLVPPVDGGPLPAGAIGKAGGVQGLARVRVDAGPAAEAVLPLVVVVHAEVAVDQMVRQAGVGIRDGLDGSAGLGLRVRHGLHGSRGIRLGLLDGVRGRIRRNLA